MRFCVCVSALGERASVLARFLFLFVSFAASRSTRTCLHTDAPERGVARRENAAADAAA